MQKYRPSKGAMFDAKGAEALGRVMEKLGEHVSPSQLVDAARPASSPIHRLFEWENGKAAEAYRIWQARNHISHLEIVIVSRADKTRSRAFHSVVVTTEDTARRGYSPSPTIRKSADLSAQVIARALRELESWKAKYSQYQGIFGGVFDAIQKVKRTQRAVA